MNIKDYIKDNILLFDGAMGTYFCSVSEDPLYKCEFANITNPNMIKQIHKRYLQAGAKAIKTNTFSVLANGSETLEFSYKQIIKAGYEIATKAAKEYEAFVFCDIGAISQPNENDFEQYKNIVDEFINLGGQNFLFETFSDSEHLNELANYIKSKVSTAYIIASFAVSPDGFTKTGSYSSNLLLSANDSIDAVGFNCVCGPHHMNKLVQENKNIKKPLLIMANASYPTIIGNRMSFENNPKYFAQQMMKNVSDGAKFIGGCCGTNPSFIKQMQIELASLQLLAAKSSSSKNSNKTDDSQQDTVIAKSDFYEKLMSNKMPIAVELDSPMTANISEFMQGASILKEAGVDLITIADCPIARARMDSSILACKLKRELEINVMPHMTCRDRNINASKALLLGLNIEQVNNVLIVTGDPIPTQQRSEVKSVYEFNSRKLIQHITNLNQTLFDSPFYLYAALNINAKNFDIQLRLAKQKVENGAMAFFTQPVLSEMALENLKRAKSELNVPIVGGILPIVSERNANFINNEIPGITVCDEIVQLYKDKDRAQCSDIAVKVSSEIARHMKPYVDGYYIMTPFKRVDIVTGIINSIK